MAKIFLNNSVYGTWDIPVLEFEFKVDITNVIKIEEFYTKNKTFSISSPLSIYGYNKVFVDLTLLIIRKLGVFSTLFNIDNTSECR